MKRIMILITLLLVVMALTACGREGKDTSEVDVDAEVTESPVVEVPTTTNSTSMGDAKDNKPDDGSVRLDFAGRLADEAVAYFLGKDYDSRYSDLFNSVQRFDVGVIDYIVLFEDAVDGEVMSLVARVAEVISLCQSVPDVEPPYEESKDPEPWEIMRAPELAAAYKEGRVPDLPQWAITRLIELGWLTQGDVVVVDETDKGVQYEDNAPADNVSEDTQGSTDTYSRYVGVPTLSDEEAAIADIFIPNGALTDIPIYDDKGNFTTVFQNWVVNLARGNGLIDSRVFEVTKGVWGVKFSDIVALRGGSVFKFFDKSITLTDADIGKALTAFEDTVYSARRQSYTYLENAVYKAVYLVETNSANTLSIVVEFYSSPSELNFSLEDFIAGVKNLRVSVV